MGGQGWALGVHLYRWYLLQTDDGRIESDYELKGFRSDDAERMEGVIGRMKRCILRAYTDEGDILLTASP